MHKSDESTFKADFEDHQLDQRIANTLTTEPEKGSKALPADKQVRRTAKLLGQVVMALRDDGALDADQIEEMLAVTVM